MNIVLSVFKVFISRVSCKSVCSNLNIVVERIKVVLHRQVHDIIGLRDTISQEDANEVQGKISWLMGTVQHSLFPLLDECLSEPLTER